MSSVDNRVVQMQFDNKEFERNVATTQNTLEDLNKSLNNLDKTKFGSGLSDAFNDIADGVDSIGSKFSSLELIAKGALERIGEKVADMALKITDEFLIDPITDGLSKYESRISNTASIYNAVKDIKNEWTQANYTLDDVTAALDKLTWYSDTTSYGFESMARVLNTMVNSGVDLNSAIPIIMGLGNSFSYLGNTATEMDGAFDWFGKAFSSGYMTLGYFNRLKTIYKAVNVNIKEELIETAESLGYLKKVEEGVWTTTVKAKKADQQVTMSGFEDTLNYGWATTEVLSYLYGDVYGKYADELYQFVDENNMINDSMDAQISAFDASVEAVGEAVDEQSKAYYESAQEAKLISEAIDGALDAISTSYGRMGTAILGEYTEAKKTMTAFNTWLVEVFASPVYALEGVITEWMAAAEGGRDDLIGILSDFFAIEEIDEQTGEIKESTGVIARIIKPIREAFLEAFPPITAERLEEIVLKIREFAQSLKLDEDQMAKVKDIASGLFSLLKVGVGIIGLLIKAVATAIDTFSPLLDMALSLGSWIKKIFDTIGEYFNGVDITNGAIEGVSYALYDLSLRIKTVFKTFTNEIEPVGTAIANSVGSLEPVLESIGNVFTTTGDVIELFFQGILDGFDPAIAKIKEGFTKIITDVANCLDYFINDMVKVPYAEGGGGIAGIVDILFLWAATAVRKGFDLISEITGKNFDELKEQIVDKLFVIRTAVENFINDFSLTKVVDGVKKAAEQVGTFVGGIVKTISELFQKVFTKTEAEQAVETMDTFGAGVKRFRENLTGGGKVLTGLTGLFKIFAGLNLSKMISGLADAIKGLGSLAKNISGIASAVSKGLTEISDTIKSVKGNLNVRMVKQICVSVLLLAAAAMAMSYANPDNIAAATLAIEGLIAGVVGALWAINKFASNPTSIFNSAKTFKQNLGELSTTLMKLGVALILFAVALSTIAGIDADKLENSMIAFTVLLTEMWIFVATMAAINKSESTSFKGIADTGTLMVKLASGVLVLANALKLVSDVEDPSAGVAIIAGLLASLAAFIYIVSKTSKEDAKNVIGLGGQMLLLALAVTQLAIALRIVGSMNPDALLKGGVAMGMILVAMVMVNKATQECAPSTMIAFAGSIAILGLALLPLAAGLAAIGILPIKVIAWGMAAIIATLASIAAVSILIENFGASGTLLKLAAVIASFGVSAFLFAAALQIILTTIIAFSAITSLIQPIIQNIKLFLLLGAVELSEALVVAVSSLIKALCAAVLESAEDIIYTLIELFNILINAIGEFLKSDGISKIAEIIGIVASAVAKIIGALLVYLFYKIPELGKMGWDAIQKALWPIGEKLYAAISNFFSTIKNFFVTAWNKAVSWVKGIPSSIVTFITNVANKIKETFKNLLGINSPSTVFEEYGGYLIDGLKNGLSNGIKKVKEAVATVCTAVKTRFEKIFRINSPSKVMEEIGEYLDLGLASGIKGESSSVFDSISGLSDGITDYFDADLSNIDTSITPVLDLSELQNGSSDLTSLLGSTNTELGSLSVAGDTTTDKLIAEIEKLREDLTKLDFSENGIGAEIRSALNNCGIYMDGSKVGSIVSNYQANVKRAAGV